jgi:hypothetical protein
MSGAIPPLPQYAFMAWSLVKAQGQLYLLPLIHRNQNIGYSLNCHYGEYKHRLLNITDCRILNILYFN